MKAKELAKKLMEHPDFDVKFSSSYGWGTRSFDNIVIGDIGYSSKLIVLDGDEED